MKPCACGCPQQARGNSAYASDACRARAWKARVGYGHQARRKARANGRKRKDSGVRPYLNIHEARELLAGRVPATVAAKVAAKLDKPAEPIPGQLDILTALEETHGHTTDSPQAPAA